MNIDDTILDTYKGLLPPPTTAASADVEEFKRFVLEMQKFSKYIPPPVVLYPDDRLRKRATYVDPSDPKVVEDLFYMWGTMAYHKGVGLAANQAGHPYNAFVMFDPDSPKNPLCVLNPEIIESEGKEECEEGCLSVPGVWAKITRPTSVTLKYQDQYGNSQVRTFKDFHAQVVAHELDHLKGLLMIDRLTPVDKVKAKKTLEILKDLAKVQLQAKGNGDKNVEE